MFLDNELGNKINSLTLSMGFKTCKYLERGEEEEGLTSSTEGLVKTGDQSVSLLGHLHLCAAKHAYEWWRHDIESVHGRGFTR